MTASETKEEFNLRYNNALEGAPGLDTFEISSYLTIAQEQFVKLMYDASKDPGNSFELHERARRSLNELVVNEKVTLPVASARGLVDESVFYEIGAGGGGIQAAEVRTPMYIVLETVRIDVKLGNNEEFNYSNRVIPVLPTTHDEFMVNYRNPFRKPNNNKVWRVDLSKENSKTTVELVATVPIKEYNVRYIAYPFPIIVENLSTAEDTAGLGLSINGKVAQAACQLNEAAQREIINIAVENAVLDYRDGTLQSRMSLDARV
jgi:hypothetical protein